mmetsp:Transcript_13113/g.37382  ORF Transcript_13113/g.37382 Transcript_13113/m.37382 type:complete len:445 (-) Transcript_13113:35-1369(-)
MSPIYDGGECTHCEGDAGAEHGFDEETPCDECGWYRRSSDGFRYPPGLPYRKAFTASTWQVALDRVEQIQEDFPELTKGAIVDAVEVVGDNDDKDGSKAREVLDKNDRENRIQEEFPEIRKDLIAKIGSMLDLTLKGKEFEDALRAIMNGAMARRSDRESAAGTRDIEDLFNKSFDLEFEEMTIDMHQRVLGCFRCHNKGASQRCTKCLVAVYCNRKCQAADWKNKSRPHKQVCSTYCQNREPLQGQQSDIKQPFPIALYSIGVVRYDFLLEDLMEKRTDLFLEEAAFAFDKEKPSAIPTGSHPMGMQISVVHNLDHARLQASVSFVVGWQKIDMPFVIFKVVDEGYGLEQMIHPPLGGPGDIPREVRTKVLENLKSFLSKAKEKNIEIISLTCGRGCMWMTDDESKGLLKEANGGKPLNVIPSMDYAMSGAMNAATEEACRQS